MCWARLLAIATISIAVTATLGQAQEKTAYSAEDVIRTFAPQALGKQKSVCFGTDDECRDEVQPGRASPSTMDLVVTFDNDSDTLKPEAKRNLVEFSRALTSPQLAEMRFEVSGHTDGRGSDVYNQGLSERRAAAVVRFLAAQGVPSSRLVARGFGSAMPRARDPMDPVNRRVETRPIS